MTDQNENRPGYKKTKVGWIPYEWEVLPAGEVFDIQLGKMLSEKARQGNNPKPYLANYNVQWGRFDLSGIQKMDFSEREMEKFRLKKGDLLVCEGGEVGRCAVWEEQITPCFYQKALHRLRPRIEGVDLFFMMYYVHLTSTSPRMVNYISQTSISHFTREQFVKFPIALPPYSKQQKIAEILSTWDAAIKQTRKLIDAKKRLKKALMQQLLTGKTKLKGFEEDSWEIAPLGRLVSPVSRPVPKPDKTYLSIGLRSHCKGTFHKFIGEPEKIMMDTLYRVEPEDLILNITFAWEGAIAFATEDDSGGLVSHRFPTFRLKTKIADIEFVRNLILTKRFIWDLGLISPGGAGRNRVMNKKDFLKIKVYMPSIKSQKKIGQVLSTAQDEINQLEAKLKALEKQKRGLMQKLLTGEIRVIVRGDHGKSY